MKINTPLIFLFHNERDVFVTSENGSWLRRCCWSHFVSKQSLNCWLVHLNVSMTTRRAKHKQEVTQTDSSNLHRTFLRILTHFAQRNEGSRQRPTGNTRSSSDRRHQWSSEFHRILTKLWIVTFFSELSSWFLTFCRILSSNLRMKVREKTDC